MTRKKKEKTIKQKIRRETKKFEESLKGMTKEEKIAANKARVAKYHPEPDLTSISPNYAKALSKLEHEKKMKERAKKLWYSIVSIPMGGLKKH